MDKLRYMFRNMSPWMWILVVVMIYENVSAQSGGLSQWIYSKCVSLPGIIIGLSFHEAAHAFASYKLGDPTPKLQGRVTLNPTAHIDILGFFFLLIAGFGWGEPVQIDPRNYKHRRRDEFIVSIAGVATNFVIALLFSFVLKFMFGMGISESSGLMGIIYEMVFYVIAINIILMVFNLIPCPPLDGWGIITQIFNLQRYEWWYTVYKNGALILMMLIILNVTDLIINPLYRFFINFLL